MREANGQTSDVVDMYFRTASGAMEEVSHRFKMQASTPEENACGKPGTLSIQRGDGCKFKDRVQKESAHSQLH